VFFSLLALSSLLFYDPICSRQYIRRNRQANLFRRLEIDYQLELRGLLHRQIGGLGTFENPVQVICDAPVAVREVRAVV
jgi:hypothetical protein